MNDFNFDKMKNFNTPNEWAEKAKEIPVITETKTPLFVFRYPRAFAVAMSFLFVVVLSVSFFVFKPDEDILPVATNAQNSEETVIRTENTHPTDNTKETEKEFESGGYVNIEPEESEPQTQANTSEKPTQKPTSSTEKIEPSEKPSETQPVNKPTDKPLLEPTSESTQNPSTSISNKPVVCRGSYSLVNSWEVNSVDIFCKIYDSNGNLMGDQDLYSYQHEASIDSMTMSMAYVSYEPASKGLLLPKGQYSFYFYNYFGTILSQGFVNVS